MSSSLLHEQLQRLPDSPGVYLMKDAAGTILYVGKAANLQNRVRSYFTGNGQRLTPKLQQLVASVAELDFYLTGSETEALILELNLIKRHHPHYNVRLKDDKSFPYLKISLNEDWPRIYLTRRPEDDGGRYFGPFTSAWSVRQTLNIIRGIFPFRTCTRKITGTDPRACLEYYLGRCLAPCTHATSQAEYAEVIREVILFLEGKQEKVARDLERRMNRAAEALDFEKAARYRDQIQSIRQVIAEQKITAMVKGEQDVIAFAQQRDTALVQVYFIRNGRLTGRENFALQGTRHETPGQIMSSFLKQFYAASPYIPPLLLLQYPAEDAAVIRDWLRGRRGAVVTLQVPRRGSKKQLVDTVADNARQHLEQLKMKQMAAPRVLETALAELAQQLKLTGAPRRMEAYDISNIQGSSAVGSMVVFENGKPRPAHYRRFRIRTVSGANDYAMLQEILERRFKRAAKGNEPAVDSWGTLPDLILIDGGRGQLNAARSAVNGLAENIPIISLAKENEEIFVPGRSEPLALPRSSPGLQLLQRLRDEAHRFAIGYYGKVHRREALASALDGIPGIGPRRKRALLRRFGTVPGIKEAPVAELAAAAGISEGQARIVKEHL